jgi:hypothetical protein
MASDRHNAAGERGESGRQSRSPACGSCEFALGTHLVASRRGYLHHGIYVGDGRVIHYAGLSRSWHRGPVEEVTLEQFAAGRSLLIKPMVDARYGGVEIVARARSRLGEDRYRLTSNNCEHFCEWCVAGEARSEQVDSLFEAPLLSLLRRFARFCRGAAAGPAHRPTDGCAA